MSCIAKSIGLLQPPLSGNDSTQASPMPFEDPVAQASAMFNRSFSSLLKGDDTASSLSSSALSSNPNATYMTGLDNEVEILSFPAGSLIVKAGEKNAGKTSSPNIFYNAAKLDNQVYFMLLMVSWMFRFRWTSHLTHFPNLTTILLQGTRGFEGANIVETRVRLHDKVLREKVCQSPRSICSP